MRHVLVTLAICALSACAGTGGDAGENRDRDGSAPAPLADAPPTTGLDSVLLAQAYVRAGELPRLYSLLVARHGELKGERYYQGRTRDRRANIKSASKSIIAALVGIAIAEGHLTGLDQPIAPFFAAYIPANADPRLRAITIENLLSMQAGLQPTSFDNYGAWVASSNWVRNAIARPFTDAPGGRMLYSTGNTHMLSAIITRATGMSTFVYARDKLARPLGIELVAWTRDPQGIYFGGNEMSLRPRDMVTFGELFRNGGRHQGKQVVPEEWVRASWTVRTQSPFNGHGYGLGWWHRRMRGHDVYFAWGYGGQYIFVVPSLELTVVTTSDAVSPREGDHNAALHALVANYIIPAAEKGTAR